jgi:hypothetical protein
MLKLTDVYKRNLTFYSNILIEKLPKFTAFNISGNLILIIRYKFNI